MVSLPWTLLDVRREAGPEHAPTFLLLLVVSALVPKHQLNEANALAKLSHYGILMAGPTGGGFIIATAGPGWGLAIDAAAFFLSSALMYRVKAPPAKGKPQRFLTDVKEGWGVVRGTPWIAVNVMASTFVVAGWHVGYGIVGLT